MLRTTSSRCRRTSSCLGHRKLRVESLEDRQLLAAVVFVDDDGAQFPFRNASTINQGIALVDPGGLVWVAAGTYAESVQINKPLTLLGAMAGANPERTYNATFESTIQPPAGDGIDILANNVLVSGFTIRNALGSGIAVFPGVDSARMGSNLLRNNVIGVSVGASAPIATGAAAQAPGPTISNTLVSFNSFQGNTFGIVTAGPQQNTLIYTNFLTLQVTAAMNLGGTFPGGAGGPMIVAGNQIYNDQPMVLANLNNAWVTANTIDHGQAGGIFIGGGVTNTSVTANVVKNNTGIGINVVGTGNTNDSISYNYLANNTVDGLHTQGALNDLFFGNYAWQNGRDGISLEASTGNTLQNNFALYDGRDGIRLDAASTGNTLVANYALYNAVFDFEDLSPPGANTYRFNFGRTQNRPGLIQYQI